MKKIIEAHRFFIQTTPMYVGEWVETMPSEEVNGVFIRYGYYRLPLRYKIYAPIAYIKFMYSTLIYYARH